MGLEQDRSAVINRNYASATGYVPSVGFLRAGLALVTLGLAGGGLALAHSTYSRYNEEEIAPYTALFQRRVTEAFEQQSRQPRLRQATQGEIIENLMALNELESSESSKDNPVSIQQLVESPCCRQGMESRGNQNSPVR